VNNFFKPSLTHILLKLFASIALTIVVGFTACSKSEKEIVKQSEAVTQATEGYEKTVLNYQSLSSLVSYPELAEALGYLAPIKLNYLGNVLGGPQDLQTLATGDVDIATAFNGAIIKAKASGVDLVTLLGSYGSDKQTFQGFYVLDGSPIKSARDLIGKTVSVNTLGAHAEFVVKDYLQRGGLTKDEISKVELTVLPPVSAEQALRARQIDVAQLSYVARDKAKERGGVRALFTDVELFGEFTAGNYAVTRKFLKDNPKTAKKLVEATAKAIEWARNSPRDEVAKKWAEIATKHGRGEADDFEKHWLSTGISQKGGLVDKREYQIWIDWLVKDGQLQAGQINADEIYDNSLNPYNTTALTNNQ
jgi:ABC-type nitrate/sulfonate/bicarbonate transport system substrate-binding protein